MNKLIGSFIALLLLASANAQASTTTITVEDKPQTVVVQQAPVTVLQPVVIDTSAYFDGEIERINHNALTMDVIDTTGKTRTVWVTQETLNTYRAGDLVQVRPTPGVREVIFVRQENNRNFEGRIINVDNSQSQILVKDTQGRDRRVTLKEGMISGYRVGDYVRINLMADLKEAKMIRTIK